METAEIQRVVKGMFESAEAVAIHLEHLRDVVGFKDSPKSLVVIYAAGFDPISIEDRPEVAGAAAIRISQEVSRSLQAAKVLLETNGFSAAEAFCSRLDPPVVCVAKCLTDLVGKMIEMYKRDVRFFLPQPVGYSKLDMTAMLVMFEETSDLPDRIQERGYGF